VNVGATFKVNKSELKVIKPGKVTVEQAQIILYLVVLQCLITVTGDTMNSKVFTCPGTTVIELGGAELKLG